MNDKTLLKQRQRAQQGTMARMKDGLRRVQINIKRANKIKSQGPTSKGICLCLSKIQGERETGKASSEAAIDSLSTQILLNCLT